MYFLKVKNWHNKMWSYANTKYHTQRTKLSNILRKSRMREIHQRRWRTPDALRSQAAQPSRFLPIHSLPNALSPLPSPPGLIKAPCSLSTQFWVLKPWQKMPVETPPPPFPWKYATQQNPPASNPPALELSCKCPPFDKLFCISYLLHYSCF